MAKMAVALVVMLVAVAFPAVQVGPSSNVLECQISLKLVTASGWIGVVAVRVPVAKASAVGIV